MPEDPKKRRFWEVDPTVFERGPKASFVQRRILPFLKELGKFGLIGLALTYPIDLVYVGLAFGGIAFWSFLAGSIVIMGLVITRLGYASNFRQWDLGWKRMAGALLGFVVAMSFYAGLFYFKTWSVAIAFGLVGIGLFFVLRRTRF